MIEYRNEKKKICIRKIKKIKLWIYFKYIYEEIIENWYHWSCNL